MACIGSDQALREGFGATTLGGEDAQSIFVTRDLATLEQAQGWEGVEIIQMPPTKEERAALLKRWAKKALKKNNKGLFSLMLLPLAACGGGDGTNSPADNQFNVVEEHNGSGIWRIDADNGPVQIAETANEYVLSPSSGADVTLAKADVAGFLSDDITVNVEASVISGLTFSGTATVVVEDIERDLDVDLGSINTSFVRTTVDASGGVTFLSTADPGNLEATAGFVAAQ